MSKTATSLRNAAIAAITAAALSLPVVAQAQEPNWGDPNINAMRYGATPGPGPAPYYYDQGDPNIDAILRDANRSRYGYGAPGMGWGQPPGRW